MKQLFKSLAKFVIGVFNELGNEVSDGIEGKNGKQVFAGVVMLALWGVICVGACVIVCVGGMLLLAYFWPIALLVALVVAGIYHLVHKGTPTDSTKGNFDPIDEELIRQRGLEMCDEVFKFMLAVIVKVACNTKLSRPHDECDIQRTTVNRDPLIINDGVVVYLVECDLEAPIDTAEKDAIRESLQRQAVREINRFPSLISNEAHGRAPVEILDVVNLQNHVMIRVVFTSAASLEMIDKSRRARLLRQQKQQTYIDADYTE